MLGLSAKATALIMTDLQEDISPLVDGSHTVNEVANRAGELTTEFCISGQPVFLVHTGWSADYAEALKQPVDTPLPVGVLSEN